MNFKNLALVSGLLINPFFRLDGTTKLLIVIICRLVAVCIFTHAVLVAIFQLNLGKLVDPRFR